MYFAYNKPEMNKYLADESRNHSNKLFFYCKLKTIPPILDLQQFPPNLLVKISRICNLTFENYSTVVL